MISLPLLRQSSPPDTLQVPPPSHVQRRQRSLRLPLLALALVACLVLLSAAAWAK